jgi:small subunit ribosomal protein S21
MRLSLSAGLKPRAGRRGVRSLQHEEEFPLQIFVRDNNIDQALKALKRKMQREGIFREMKRRSAYEKPSVKRAREKAEGIRRSRKAARKLAQREGLLPAPKKRAVNGRRPARPSSPS